MKELGIGTIAIPRDTHTKITQYQNCSGKSFIQVAADFVVGRLSRDRHYYAELAKFDASLRGLSFREYGEIVLGNGYESLPQRTQPQEVKVPGKPLEGVIVPNDDLVEANLARIPLGNLNYVLILNAIEYEPYSRRSYISLILFDHIQRRWSERFAFQVAMEEVSNWI